MFTKAAFISWKYSKNNKIVKYYQNVKQLFSIFNMLKCHLFLWYKAEFPASLLQCHMILQKSF